MSSRKFREALVVATASVMAVFAVGAAAQAPAGGPPRGGGMGMGMGMGAADRPTTIERMGLNDPALKLTAAQQAQIDKIIDGYIAEQKTLAEKYPMTPGSPPGQDAMQARRTARDNLNAALGKVLNDEQRKSWEAAQAARRPQGGPGGPPPGNR
jgi:Spy/CpxP family protein refolding chaperone